MRKKFEFKELGVGFPFGITLKWGKKEPEEHVKGFACNAHNSMHYTENNASYESYKPQNETKIQG